jgi:hypothetical protein
MPRLPASRRHRGAVGDVAAHFSFSFGHGSLSEDAIAACRTNGIEPIVGGCPMMFCGPVDFGHKCFRWWLGMRHRLPT